MLHPCWNNIQCYKSITKRIEVYIYIQSINNKSLIDIFLFCGLNLAQLVNVGIPKLEPRAKGPTDHFLKVGFDPPPWDPPRGVIFHSTTLFWTNHHYQSSTAEVISKTFPILDTQGTTGDQFLSRPRCHLPLSSPWKTP